MNHNAHVVAFYRTPAQRIKHLSAQLDVLSASRKNDFVSAWAYDELLRELFDLVINRLPDPTHTH